MKAWIAFFSHTGSEIGNLVTKYHLKPTLVVTNKKQDEFDAIDSVVKKECAIYKIPNKPSVLDYKSAINYAKQKLHWHVDDADILITLHGFMRIIPSEVLKMYSEIYNLHPGLITKYPELKGKDPQEKAVKLGLKTSGAVIHKVTSVLDSGPVISYTEVSIEGLNTQQVIDTIKQKSLELWVDFLKQRWC